MSSPVRVVIPSPIHKATTSSSSSRYPGLHNVAAFVSAAGTSILAATDGKMLSLVPTTASGDKGCHIIPHAAAKACKRTRSNPEPTITLNGRAEIDGGASFPIPESRAFPPVHDVLPKREEVQSRVSVRLDPKLLLTLAESLGSGGNVTLVINPSGGKAIVVVPHSPASPSGAVGLLMPIQGRGDEDRDDALGRIEEARALISSVVGS